MTIAAEPSSLSGPPLETRVELDGLSWKTLDLGRKGGKLSGATKMCSLRTEKLSCNWRSRKKCLCLVKVPTVDKKLSCNWQRGEDFLYGMVPFRFSFSPMRGIKNREITLLGLIKKCD